MLKRIMLILMLYEKKVLSPVSRSQQLPPTSGNLPQNTTQAYLVVQDPACLRAMSCNKCLLRLRLLWKLLTDRTYVEISFFGSEKINAVSSCPQ